MLINTICFLSGMILMRVLQSLISLGYAVNVIKQTQQSCASLFMSSEQGLFEVLNLKYLAMKEANRSNQNIIAQKYIDQLNIESVKKSIMRNYVGTFPEAYNHLLEFSNWEELEDYVERFMSTQKEAK